MKRFTANACKNHPAQDGSRANKWYRRHSHLLLWSVPACQPTANNSIARLLLEQTLHVYRDLNGSLTVQRDIAAAHKATMNVI